MARRKKFVPYQRKLEGKTDYKKRMTLLKSGKCRLVVRKSLKNIWLQIIEYSNSGDKVLVSAHSRELAKLGWKGYRKNTAAAYLTGLLCGTKAMKKGIKEAVFDSGLYVSTKGSVTYAALKGALDSGLKVPHSEEQFPKESRLKGDHLKKGAEDFEKLKKKILGGSK